MIKIVLSILITFSGILMLYFYLANHPPKINEARLLLSTIRGGDYAHPGDEESIQIVIDELKKIDRNIEYKKTLDIGCGFGGTLNFFQSKDFRDIQGIDIDESAIKYAIKKYPGIKFHTADILNLPETLKKSKFELITLFSVSYSIKDKNKLIQSISNIAQKDAILVIFDYGSTNYLSVKDFAQKKCTQFK